MAEKTIPDVSDSARDEQTSSRISVNPLYTPADLSGTDYDRDIGFPG